MSRAEQIHLVQRRPAPKAGRAYSLRSGYLRDVAAAQCGGTFHASSEVKAALGALHPKFTSPPTRT